MQKMVKLYISENSFFYKSMWLIHLSLIIVIATLTYSLMTQKEIEWIPNDAYVCRDCPQSKDFVNVQEYRIAFDTYTEESWTNSKN